MKAEKFFLGITSPAHMALSLQAGAYSAHVHPHVDAHFSAQEEDPPGI